MPLPRCVDPPPTPTVDCARMEHEDAVRDLLCPRLLRVQQASCSTLSDATELAAHKEAAEAAHEKAGAHVAAQEASDKALEAKAQRKWEHRNHQSKC